MPDRITNQSDCDWPGTNKAALAPIARDFLTTSGARSLELLDSSGVGNIQHWPLFVYYARVWWPFGCVSLHNQVIVLGVEQYHIGIAVALASLLTANDRVFQ